MTRRERTFLTVVAVLEIVAGAYIVAVSWGYAPAPHLSIPLGPYATR